MQSVLYRMEKANKITDETVVEKTWEAAHCHFGLLICLFVFWLQLHPPYTLSHNFIGSCSLLLSFLLLIVCTSERFVL